MKTLNLNKVDAASEKFFTILKENNLVSDHDMIIFTDDYRFHAANSSLVKLSENPKNILRAYRIDSLGNLWVA